MAPRVLMIIKEDFFALVKQDLRAKIVIPNLAVFFEFFNNFFVFHPIYVRAKLKCYGLLPGWGYFGLNNIGEVATLRVTAQKYSTGFKKTGLQNTFFESG